MRDRKTSSSSDSGSESDAADAWQNEPEFFQQANTIQSSLTLAAVLAFSLGSIVFVVGLVFSGLLLAIVGSVVVTCLVGLAVAMLNP